MTTKDTRVDHSPLPWRWTPCEMDVDDTINSAGLLTGDRSVFTVDCGDWNGLSDADAAFIVRACNAHDRLTAVNAKAKRALDLAHSYFASHATGDNEAAEHFKRIGNVLDEMRAETT